MNLEPLSHSQIVLIEVNPWLDLLINDRFSFLPNELIGRRK